MNLFCSECHNTATKNYIILSLCIYSEIRIKTIQITAKLSELVRKLFGEQPVFNFDSIDVRVYLYVSAANFVRQISRVCLMLRVFYVILCDFMWINLERLNAFVCLMSQCEVFDKNSVHVPEINWLWQ